MTGPVLKFSPIALALQTVNTARVRDEHNIGTSDEQSAFNDSNHLPDPRFKRCGIGYWAKAAVENAITAVSDEGLARCRSAKPRGGTDQFESHLSCFEAKGDDFHRNRCTGTQPIHHLHTVHDDCEPSAPARPQLLPDKPPAAAP